MRNLALIFLSTVILSKVNVKIIIIGTLWFGFGLLPVIFLPQHAFSMYVVISSVGIFYLFARALDKLIQAALDIASVSAKDPSYGLPEKELFFNCFSLSSNNILTSSKVLISLGARSSLNRVNLGNLKANLES